MSDPAVARKRVTLTVVLGLVLAAAAAVVVKKVRNVLEAVRIVDVETVSVWSDGLVPEE